MADPEPTQPAAAKRRPKTKSERRGIAIVAALAVTETTSFGVVYYGFGTLLPATQKALGYSKVQLSGAFSLALLLSGLVGLVVGRHLDTHDPRPVLTSGSVLATLGTVLWSRANSLPTYYLAWTIIGVSMGMILYEPAFVVVTQWFRGKERRQALTAVTLLAGLASTIFVPLQERLLEHYGWRTALQIMAVILGGITIPLHAFVIKRAPGFEHEEETVDSVVHLTRGEAVGDRRFRYLLAANVALAMTFSAMVAHQISFLEERHWTPAAAAVATGAIGLWQVGGRAVFAPFSSRTRSQTVTTLTYAAQFVGLVLLLFSAARPTVAVYVALAGISRGMFTLVRATLIAELFGTKNYGSISSVVAMATAASQAVGPLVGGALETAWGSYGLMIAVMAGLAGVATVLAAQIERVPTGEVAPGLG
jgi:MFS family permease